VELALPVRDTGVHQLRTGNSHLVLGRSGRLGDRDLVVELREVMRTNASGPKARLPVGLSPAVAGFNHAARPALSAAAVSTTRRAW
jgi:hypothetical protein